MDLDAEHWSLVSRVRAAVCETDASERSRLSDLVGTSSLIPRFSIDREIHGDDNGTRNLALALGRTDSGDHSAVVVLRPLTPDDQHFERRSGFAAREA